MTDNEDEVQFSAAGYGVEIQIAYGDAHWKVAGFRECLGDGYAAGLRFDGEFDKALMRAAVNQLMICLGCAGCPDERFRRKPLEPILYLEQTARDA